MVLFLTGRYRPEKLRMDASFYYTGDCSSEQTRRSIIDAVSTALANTYTDTTYASKCAPGSTCSYENLEVICGNTTRRRREITNARGKRQAPSDSILVHVVFTLSGTITSVDQLYVLEDSLIVTVDILQDSIRNGSFDITGFDLSPDSFVRDTYPAQECPKGTMFVYDATCGMFTLMS